MNKYIMLSNDVETHSIFFNCLREETGIKVIKEGLPLLLDLYAKYNIQTTFFFVADFAKKHPEIVNMILPYGHEVASHGYIHEPDQAFDIMPLKMQIEHLKKSKQILEDISGQEVISFRAPALRINKNTALALAEADYRIDSSVPSQRLDMFLSFGSLRKMKWLTAPRLPYRTKKDELTKKGDGPIVEVPLSAMLIPYVGTTMRIIPWLNSMQRHFLHWESSINYKPVVFYIHPTELIDEKNESGIIKRRSNNIISYLLVDLLKSKLKLKNLGSSAVLLYESQIDFYVKRDYRFTTIKEYCSEKSM